MNLINRIGASLLNGQHGHPTGFVGRMLGEQEEQIIPDMQQLGFTLAYIQQGPASRQFKTTAVIGVK